MKPPSPATSDRCIRTPLLAWLRSQHAGEEATGFLEEFKMPRPSARIDIAVVNGELAGFEIKSDLDTLRRLKVQVPAFSRFFDKVSIVTTAKHLSSTRRVIPPWWGLVMFRDGEFAVARRAKRNLTIDARSLLFALTRSEIAVLYRYAGLPPAASHKKAELVEAAVTNIPRSDLSNYARAVLRLRA